MKTQKLTLLLALCCFFATAQSPAVDSGQVKKDTVRTSATSAYNQPDDEGVFLLPFALAILAIMAAAVLLGIAVLVGFLLALFAMVSAGILSTGILVGMRRKSASVGFRVMVILICCLIGLFTGATGLWLVNHGFHLRLEPKNVLLYGSVGGTAGGLVLGLICAYTIRMFMRYAKQRFSL